eukprot:gene10904-12709_t
MQPFTVKVPGTSANLGCGFDTLSLAVKLYMRTQVSLKKHDDGTNKQEEGLGSLYTISYSSSKEYNLDSPISTNPDDNFLTTTLHRVLQDHNVQVTDIIPMGHRLHIDVDNDIPVGRGMGSSAATIGTAMIIANHIAQLNLTPQQLFNKSTKYEPSADNLSAVFFGGFNIVMSADSVIHVQTVPMPIITPLRAIIIIPHIQVLTMDARRVLPDAYSRADVVYNMQRVSMLTYLLTSPSVVSPSTLSSFATMQPLMIQSMLDRVHQPYRAKLVPGFQDLLDLANKGGLDGMFGLCLSGSGSTILCLAYEHHAALLSSLQSVFTKHNIKTDGFIVEFDNQGGSVIQG